jgi:hypothetical protein
MSSQVISILTQIQKDLTEVKKKLENLEPAYGSEAWWKWSNSRAAKDYKEGRYKEISSKKELNSLLKTLKN